MHDCPRCDSACYCDEEDMMHEVAPEDCSHLCIQLADDDDYPVDEETAMQGVAERDKC